MCDFPGFEQEYYATTAEALYQIGHISTRLMKMLT